MIHELCCVDGEMCDNPGGVGRVPRTVAALWFTLFNTTHVLNINDLYC